MTQKISAYVWKKNWKVNIFNASVTQFAKCIAILTKKPPLENVKENMDGIAYVMRMKTQIPFWNRQHECLTFFVRLPIFSFVLIRKAETALIRFE